MNDDPLIQNLIGQGEGPELAFRANLRKKNLAQTLCSFLNGNGGIAVIGVAENGSMPGTTDTAFVEADLAHYLFSSIVPEAPVSLSQEIAGSTTILLVKVCSGPTPPYVFDGSIWMRKGNITTRATARDVADLVARRQKNELHWERRPALGIGIEDLDELEIKKTLHDLDRCGRGKTFTEQQTEDFLTYYGLYQNGNLTNAAVVLFAKEPARWLPQCRIRLTVLPGTKADDRFSYDRVPESNLFRNIEDILQFFDVHIAVNSSFSHQQWQRTDSGFPKAALREGLMNALVHRDYSNVSGTVSLVFYRDRLEITSYGELPAELTPADLGRNHLSLPRNPCIAHICFLRGWIEKIGRGTIKMMEDCEAQGLSKPEWRSSGGITSLVFPGVTVTANQDGPVDEAVTNTVNEAINNAIKNVAVTNISHGIRKQLHAMVRYLAEQEKGASLEELLEITGKANATAKRYLLILKLSGLVEFRGAAKTGRYCLKPGLVFTQRRKGAKKQS